MGGKLRLDGVVCVVDSKNIIQVSGPMLDTSFCLDHLIVRLQQLEHDQKPESGNECSR